MPGIRSFALAIAIALLGFQMFTAPSHARIRCDGRYQVNLGGTVIATPYCAAHYMFEVASGS